MGKIETITSKVFGDVRTVKLDGTMYFSSRDVQNILGFGETINAVYMFVPGKYTRTILRSECGDTSIPKRGMPFVTAGGVSALARQSKEPFAKDFKRWIESVQEEFKMKETAVITANNNTTEINSPIEIVYAECGNPTVSGRELHKALEIGTEYAKWFDRMCEYGFYDGKDYSTILTNRSDGKAGKPKTDHQLTIPMAKELCMIQRTEKGRQFRQYFIDIEERWNTPEAVMARALQMAGKQLEEIKHKNSMLTGVLEEQQRQLTAMQPKADYCDTILAADDLIPITIIAKEYGMTAREMNNLLHKEHIQYKQGGTWLLYKEYADKGLTKTKTNRYRGYDGNQHVSIHTYWTQKGRHFIYEILKSKGVMPAAE